MRYPPNIDGLRRGRSRGRHVPRLPGLQAWSSTTRHHSSAIPPSVDSSRPMCCFTETQTMTMTGSEHVAADLLAWLSRRSAGPIDRSSVRLNVVVVRRASARDKPGGDARRRRRRRSRRASAHSSRARGPASPMPVPARRSRTGRRTPCRPSWPGSRSRRARSPACPGCRSRTSAAPPARRSGSRSGPAECQAYGMWSCCVSPCTFTSRMASNDGVSVQL